MSDTPRIDATQYQWTRTLDLARTLERELAVVTRERDEAREEVEFRMADSVALIDAQERIRYLEMDLAEKERPLDAEMARLNQNLIAANDAVLKAGLERDALRAEVERLRGALGGIRDRDFKLSDAKRRAQRALLATEALQEPTR